MALALLYFFTYPGTRDRVALASLYKLMYLGSRGRVALHTNTLIKTDELEAFDLRQMRKVYVKPVEVQSMRLCFALTTCCRPRTTLKARPSVVTLSTCNPVQQTNNFATLVYIHIIRASRKLEPLL